MNIGASLFEYRIDSCSPTPYRVHCVPYGVVENFIANGDDQCVDDVTETIAQRQHTYLLPAHQMGKCLLWAQDTMFFEMFGHIFAEDQTLTCIWFLCNNFDGWKCQLMLLWAFYRLNSKLNLWLR